MNTEDGTIRLLEQIKGDKRFIEMGIAPTEKQMGRKPPRVAMYEPCGCGSGKKFKWCCYQKGKKP